MSSPDLGRFCRVCYAPVSQATEEPSPAAWNGGVGPYRMNDVLHEIREIHRFATGAETTEDLAKACERAELLLVSLRRQFVYEVIVGHPTRAPETGSTVDPSRH
jgi:hypothetical protein